MQIKPLVIFDIDGTLANTVEADDFCYSDTFKTLYGIDLGKIDWSAFPHVTDLGVCKNIFKTMLHQNLTGEALAETKTHFVRILETTSLKKPQLFQEISGAIEFFTQLRLSKFPVAIATGGWEQSAKFKLDKIGLDFNNLPLAHSDHHYSRAEIMKTAIRLASNRYGIDFSKIVYFGDGEWDYATCQELEIEFIGIDNGKTGKLLDLGAKTVFQDFTDSKKIMEAIVRS